MYYIFLQKKVDLVQENIIDYFNQKRKQLSIKINLLYFDDYIIEKYLPIITNDDYVFFHPLLASRNLSIVKAYNNSIIVLPNKTIQLQKLSNKNPINENFAINHNLRLLYINEYDDLTNEDWKLVISPEIVTIDSLVESSISNHQ